MRAIVLTGGPHAGKTTLVNALASRGVPVVPEAALGVIEELNTELGSHDAQRAWRLSHAAEFQVRVAQRQRVAECAERAAAHPVVILDRGILDGLAYCRFLGREPPTELVELCAAATYSLVALCELVTPFDNRIGSGRFSSEAQARELEGLLEAEYARHGVPVVRLPVLPHEKRVRRVLELGGLT